MGEGPAMRKAPAMAAQKRERAARLVIRMRTKATIGGKRGTKSTRE